MVANEFRRRWGLRPSSSSSPSEDSEVEETWVIWKRAVGGSSPKTYRAIKNKNLSNTKPIREKRGRTDNIPSPFFAPFGHSAVSVYRS